MLLVQLDLHLTLQFVPGQVVRRWSADMTVWASSDVDAGRRSIASVMQALQHGSAFRTDSSHEKQRWSDQSRHWTRVQVQQRQQRCTTPSAWGPCVLLASWHGHANVRACLNSTGMCCPLALDLPMVIRPDCFGSRLTGFSPRTE